MKARRHDAGFTLIEMVVSITISAIILVFVGMFIVAPMDAYQANGRRAEMVADVSTAWPRMQEDIRQALPNSLRWTRNGNFVALEMLQVVGHARYAAAPSALFDVAGTAAGVFGSYAAGATLNGMHLSVNNAGQEAYTQTLSMTPAIQVRLLPNGVAGEASVQLAAPPAINTNSPRNRVYLVRMPVTYLCDEGQGTMRRYSGYAIAAAQAARDTPAELAGGASELVARGLSACRFDTLLAAGQPQIVAVHLTTTRNNETVTLMHSAAVENLP